MEKEKDVEEHENPREKASYLSALTFCWMIPIYKRAYKKYFNTTDLYNPLNEDRSKRLADKLEEAWKNERGAALQAHRKPRLVTVLFKMFGFNLMLYGLLLAILELVVRLAQPICLGLLVSTFSVERNDEDIYEAYVYSVIIILSSFTSLIIYYPCVMGIFHIALKIKVACSSLIYRKALRLTGHVHPTGHIVNLISNDVNFDNFCLFCHNLWLGPLLTVLVSFIMYQEIGWCALIGVFLIIGLIPFQAWLTQIAKKMKRKSNKETDSRLQLTNEVIKGILVIKMYTWEKIFQHAVSRVRRKELNYIKNIKYIKSIHMAFMLFRTRTAIFASILAFVLTGNVLSARKVFMVIACFNTMKRTVTDLFTFAIEQVAFAKVSMDRIQQFLLKDELYQFCYSDDKDIEISTSEPKVILKNVTVKLGEDQEFVLHNLNFETCNNKLVFVVGGVGSGKTSFLNIIMKELPITEGKINISGNISYASQNPWLFNGTVQQNILFGLKYDEERYNRVLDACALPEDLESFPLKDHTIVGEGGTTLSGGQRSRINLARALYRDVDIYILDDPFSALDNKVSEYVFEKVKEHLKHKICILTTNNYEHLDKSDQIVLLKHGRIIACGNYEELKEEYPDWNTELGEYVQVTNNVISDCVSWNKLNGSVDSSKVQEKNNSGRVSWSVYFVYSKAFGNVFVVIGIFLIFVLTQMAASGSDYFLGYWVNQEQKQVLMSSEDTSICEICVYKYSVLVIVTVVSALCGCFLYYSRGVQAAMNLHKSMLSSTLDTSMRFFHENPPGWILNRFSRDIANIDGPLQTAVINFVQTALSILGIIIIIAVVNPFTVIPMVIAFLVLYKLRSMHLYVSNNLTRLERTSRNPVTNLVTSSMQGLVTIRAMKAEQTMFRQFDEHQDTNTSAKFLVLTSTRMFAFWLEIVCSLYTTVVIISFLFYGNDYGGNVGLAITQAMSMIGLIQWGIRQSSELENQMTSVERISEYINLPTEHPELPMCVKPPAGWPNHGKIEFHNVSLSYTDNIRVLKNINFTINPREKIGVIGRTGAGKSSLINALLQLASIEGNIIIDQINISQLELRDLRSKISIIPQEPVLFSGTIRNNIDPYNLYSDSNLWNVIETVELKQCISELDQGVYSEIIEDGGNFSVGQRQLICLARAIVKNNQVLVLDEATANIDPHTDKLIQKSIRKHFKACTVITIAHRLQNVIDCDKIMVIENGVITEFDRPSELLKNDASYLTSILQNVDENTKNEFISTAEKQNITKRRS